MERVGFCQVVLGPLVQFINSTFQCEIDIHPAWSPMEYVNTMLHASALIAGVVSLGCWWVLPKGGICAQHAHSARSAHITGRNWEFLLQLAIFLPM